MNSRKEKKPGKQPPAWLARARSGWKYDGSSRPSNAEEPGPGQESVWDYPRPPRIEPCRRHIIVRLGETVIVETSRAVRVLETASPPTIYLPPDDAAGGYLEKASGRSMCEWKGEAQYWTVRVGDRAVERGGWSYPSPFAEFQSLAGYLSFYPALFECLMDDERVKPQPGGFYGGWVTCDIVGPMKGLPGTESW